MGDVLHLVQNDCKKQVGNLVDSKLAIDYMNCNLRSVEFALKAMEAQAPVLVIITFFLFLVLHRLVKYYKPKSSVTHKLPPGPRKLPLIGNLHQLALAGSLPHRSLQKLACKYGPLIHLQLGEISAVVVSSSKLAKDILKTHDLAFVQRPQLLAAQILAYGATDIAFAPYGDHWREMRKICTMELLSAKRVRSFSFIREDETAKFIESIRAHADSPVNVSSRIFSLISAFTSRAAFGDEPKDKDEFVSLIRKMIELAGRFDLADLFPSIKAIHFITGMKAKMEKLQKRLDEILENIVEEHQEKQTRAKEGRFEEEEEDLVDVLLRIQRSNSLDKNKITTTDIKAVILDVFAAGTDTSASTLGWAMTELMRNPRVRKKAHTELRKAFRGKETIHESDLEELNYLNLVIKETLRLHAPTPLLIPRECSELTIIDGYEIPIKTEVMVNVWAIGRDPQHWNDAEKFIPERFDGSSIDFKGNNFEYLPFGAGRRMCPGVSFGLATLMLPLALLLYHFNWEIPNGIKPEDLDMTEYYGLAIGRKNELCLIPTVYDPSLHA